MWIQVFTKAIQKVKNVCVYSPRTVLLHPIIGFWWSVWCWKLPHAVICQNLSRGKCTHRCGHRCADLEFCRLWGARCYLFSTGQWDLRLSCRRGKLLRGSFLAARQYTSTYCQQTQALLCEQFHWGHLRASPIQSEPGTIGLFPVSKNERVPCW